MGLVEDEGVLKYKGALEALEAATAALSGLPGPKALVFITGSLPLPIGPGNPIRHYLAKTTATANANRVTLYGLGVPTRGNAFDKTQGLLMLADHTGGIATIDPFDPSVLFSRMAQRSSPPTTRWATCRSKKAGGGPPAQR